MKLSFSTLGCPAWTLDQIVKRAAQYRFDGIAFRGLGGELEQWRLNCSGRALFFASLGRAFAAERQYRGTDHRGQQSL